LSRVSIPNFSSRPLAPLIGAGLQAISDDKRPFPRSNPHQLRRHSRAFQHPINAGDADTQL
jgi:hypothetical protein